MSFLRETDNTSHSHGNKNNNTSTRTDPRLPHNGSRRTNESGAERTTNAARRTLERREGHDREGDGSNEPTGDKPTPGDAAAVALGAPATMAAERHPYGNHYYLAVDIRIFLTVMTLAMAGSFILGVSLGPPLSSTMNVAKPNLPPTKHHLQRQQGEHSTTVRDYSSISSDAADSETDNFSSLQQQQLQVGLFNQIYDDLDESKYPAGQHLLVDLEGVEADFLNSEQRLSRAMVDTVAETGLTMISYHCHALLPSGVSCVGVLAESSHISFHTWPEDGVITLDLFTCASQPLLSAVKTMERLFGVPNATFVTDNANNTDPTTTTTIRSQWSHELRGFRPTHVRRKDYLDDSSDLTQWVLSPLDMHSKTQIYSGLTNYHRVDIWDIVEKTDVPDHTAVCHLGLQPGDPRATDPTFASPDRIMFLDGKAHSVGSSEHVYYEAMTHPAMFAHADPQRILLVGAGDGAVVREILKHTTVQAVTVLERDKEMIPIVREHLPMRNNCSDLIGRASNCFDDVMVQIYFEPGPQWFLDHYGQSSISSSVPFETSPDLFDVIFLNHLEPMHGTEDDQAFISSLMKSLSPEGMLSIPVGPAASIDDPRPDYGVYKSRDVLFQLLEANEDVQAMLIYEEEHCGFLEPRAFLIVCKSVTCRSRWYARSEQVDYDIYERITRTHSKQQALSFYDGTTQHNYQWPKKGWETVYCRRDPIPFECSYRHLDLFAPVFEFHWKEDEGDRHFTVEVKEADNGMEESRVYAANDIPKGSYIMPWHLASSLAVSDRNFEGLKHNTEVEGGGKVAVIEDLLEFFKDYAHSSVAIGSSDNFVEIGATVLIRRVDDPKDANVKKWMPQHPSGKRPKYSPVYERHRVSFDVFIVASEDIGRGEEIKILAGL